MTAEIALKRFLERALVSKKSRYLEFVAKPKTRRKFLETIYHQLEGDLDEKRRLASLPDAVLAMPGYVFCPPDTFGNPVNAIEAACDQYDESFLVVSQDGRYAIHGPETMIDSRAFYCV